MNTVSGKYATQPSLFRTNSEQLDLWSCASIQLKSHESEDKTEYVCFD